MWQQIISALQLLWIKNLCNEKTESIEGTDFSQIHLIARSFILHYIAGLFIVKHVLLSTIFAIHIGHAFFASAIYYYYCTIVKFLILIHMHHSSTQFLIYILNKKIFTKKKYCTTPYWNHRCLIHVNLFVYSFNTNFYYFCHNIHTKEHQPSPIVGCVGVCKC